MSDEKKPDAEAHIPLEEHNVFQDAPGIGSETTVPVVIEVGEGKRQVGEAELSFDGSGVYANIYLKNDNPEEVLDFLKGGLTRISVSDAAPELKDSEMAALYEFPPHAHNPVQHRDGREPWCDECGLSVRFDKPIDRLEYGRPSPTGNFGKPNTKNFGFPEPSRLHKTDDDSPSS